jgi:hypothetical protein
MRLFWLGVAYLSLASCDRAAGVTVTNNADSDVVNLTVLIASEKFHKDKLEPGARATFRHHPRGDGVIDVSYMIGGRPVSERFGYVTRNSQTRYRVSIGRTGMRIDLD